jgi:hypothetical protein
VEGAAVIASATEDRVVVMGRVGANRSAGRLTAPLTHGDATLSRAFPPWQLLALEHGARGRHGNLLSLYGTKRWPRR